MAIVLSQPQFLQIANAASALFPSERERFVIEVATALEGRPAFGDGDVYRVIREMLPRYGHPEPEHVPARWERDRPRFERASKRAY